MDDQEFFDALHQLWSKTTGAGNLHWTEVPMEDKDAFGVVASGGVLAEFKPVLEGATEEDARFTAFVHGALPEIVRRIQDAIDESDRLDVEKDDLIGRIADLEMEADGLRQHIDGLLQRIADLEGR
jgi:hypothetical protein